MPHGGFCELPLLPQQSTPMTGSLSGTYVFGVPPATTSVQNPDAAQLALSFGRVVATRSPTTVFSQASATSSGVARSRRLMASSAGKEPDAKKVRAGCRD